MCACTIQIFHVKEPIIRYLDFSTVMHNWYSYIFRNVHMFILFLNTTKYIHNLFLFLILIITRIKRCVFTSCKPERLHLISVYQVNVKLPIYLPWCCFHLGKVWCIKTSILDYENGINTDVLVWFQLWRQDNFTALWNISRKNLSNISIDHRYYMIVWKIPLDGFQLSKAHYCKFLL